MTVENMERELRSLLFNEKVRQQMLDEYDRVIEILGSAGASERAAHQMITLLKK